MIEYSLEGADLTERDLAPFFEGWRTRPSPAKRLEILRAAHSVVLARADGRLVGFVSAISDGVSWAYIPLLEVVPAFRGQGIGTELMRRILDHYKHLYAIDLSCDDDLVPFYARLGMTRLNGMLVRNEEALG